jgi:fluoride ion exporter CrcB/FEX
MAPHVTLKPKQFIIAIFAVMAGGAVGTLSRDLLLKLEPVQTGTDWTTRIPWVLLSINLVGVLLATRMLRGPLRHRDPNDLSRLLIITGLFGGFTSYSSLFADLAAIWHLSIAGCLFVAAGALLSGVFAAWLGLMRRRAR